MSGDEPASFPFHYPVQVRFRDLDPMGHAHHSLPLIYFEEARAAYWREVAGRAGLDDVDYILAGATLHFHARVHWPARLDVGMRTARLGGKSFTLEYGIWGEDGHLLCSGETTQVMYDYEAGHSVPIPAELRQRLEQFEAGA